MTPGRARHHLVDLAAVALLLLAGCGSGAPAPAEDVPELADTLHSIDEAISDQRYQQARRRLDVLVGLTVEAREAGDLEPQRADRILAAAAQLMSALPPPTTSPTPSPAPSPTDNREEDDSEEDDSEEDD